MTSVIHVDVSGTLVQSIELNEPWQVSDLVDGTLLTTIGSSGEIRHSETLEIVGKVTFQEVLDDTEYVISAVFST